MVGRLVPPTGGSDLLAGWTKCVLLVQVVAECGAPGTRDRGVRSGARTVQHAGRVKKKRLTDSGRWRKVNASLAFPLVSRHDRRFNVCLNAERWHHVLPYAQEREN